MNASPPDYPEDARPDPSVPHESNPYDPPDIPPPDVPAAATVEAIEADLPQRPPHPHIGWALLWTLLIFSAQLGVGIVIGILLFAVAAASGERPTMGASASPMGALLLVGCGTLTTVVLAAVVVIALFGRRAIHLMGLRGCSASQWGLSLLFLLPLSVVGSEVSIWAAEFLPSFNLEMFELLARAHWLAVFIAVCLFPGIGEELYFRGFLSRGLIGNHGLVVGSLLASALFALMHLDPVQVCGTFVIGLGLQFLFLATRSLVVVMVVHTLNNAVAFGLMSLGDRFYIPGVTELEKAEGGLTAFVHTPLPIFLAACAVLGLLCLCLFRMRTHWKMPDGTAWTPAYPATESPPPQLAAEAFHSAPGGTVILATLIGYALFLGSLWSYLSLG